MGREKRCGGSWGELLRKLCDRLSPPAKKIAPEFPLKNLLKIVFKSCNITIEFNTYGDWKARSRLKVMPSHFLSGITFKRDHAIMGIVGNRGGE